MNTPLKSKEIKKLPKGYYPSKEVNRKYRRALIAKKMQFIVTPAGTLELVPMYPPNCRKLTIGRSIYKQKKYGRIHGKNS